jgi:hypothetical protein
MDESFMLKSVDDIVFKNNIDLKQFISQFQIHCKKLLCIVNDKILRFYSKKENLPKNLKYIRMEEHNIAEYYFEDLDTNDIYCIFGKNAATIFYPALELKSKPIIVSHSNKEPKAIFIYHHDKKHEIKWSNKEIEIIEIKVFE